MSGTTVDTPYYVMPKTAHISFAESCALMADVPSVRGRFVNYIEVPTLGPSNETRALFALPQIGREGALSSSWQQFRCARDVKPNWDGYGAATPNAVALANSQSLIKALTEDGLFPDHIQPSPEGGITISFLRGARHAAIELHNDGDAVGVISRVEGAPEVWEFSPTGDEQVQAIGRISSFVQG